MSKTRRNLTHTNGNGHRLEDYFKDSHGNGKVIKNSKSKEEVLDLTLKTQPIGRTPNQKKYLATIAKNKLTIVTGPAGVGKTCLAMGMAAKYLSDGVVDRIIMVRPLISCDEEVGFLPGDLNAKVDPFMRPIFDELGEYFTEEQITKLTSGRRPIAEIVPLAFMKGRTLKKAFIVLDESQDATYKQIKMLLTRMGDASKIVLTGDITQTDRVYIGDSPLEEVIRKMHNAQGVGFAQLTPEDNQRDPFVELVQERL